MYSKCKIKFDIALDVTGSILLNALRFDGLVNKKNLDIVTDLKSLVICIPASPDGGLCRIAESIHESSTNEITFNILSIVSLSSDFVNICLILFINSSSIILPPSLTSKISSIGIGAAVPAQGKCECYLILLWRSQGTKVRQFIIYHYNSWYCKLNEYREFQ